MSLKVIVIIINNVTITALAGTKHHGKNKTKKAKLKTMGEVEGES